MVKQQTTQLFTEKILKTFNEVIKDYPTDAILLSGGLDTSILACMLSRYLKPYAVTVGLAGEKVPDLPYARLIAKLFKFPIYVKLFSVREAVEAAKNVIKIIKSFDPVEVRNDISIYIAMKKVRELGFRSVVTGDGGDELFAGYSFLFKLKPYEVGDWIKNIVKNWFFSAKPIGESLGLKVLQPFLDERIVNLALEVPAELKIAEKNGVTYGKWVLRESFKKMLPSEILWRTKNPIEVGSGSVRLSKIFKVSQEEFTSLSEIVNINSQEQAYYLKLYLKIFGGIPKPRKGEKPCPKCGAGIPINAKYCRVCGLYPAY